jgi:hypothetical protein
LKSEKIKILDWKPKWDGGAPMPRVYSGDFKIYLTYVIADWEKESISEYRTLEHNGYEEYHALVEFHGKTFKFGLPTTKFLADFPSTTKDWNGHK